MVIYKIIVCSNKKIEPTTPTEVTKKIKTNLNPNEAPGYDLVTGTVLNGLARKGNVKLTLLLLLQN